MSLYDDLGGPVAVSAALEKFYPKVMADPRTSPFFEGINIEDLKKRVAPFLATALGGQDHYHGPGLRQAHAHLVSRGLDDSAFDAFLLHFQDVLSELGVSPAKIAEIIPLFSDARSAVLNR